MAFYDKYLSSKHRKRDLSDLDATMTTTVSYKRSKILNHNSFETTKELLDN